jgi:hypothetical protein
MVFNLVRRIAMDELVKLAGSRGYKVSPEAVPTAVETLEHLERTLDDLDPVVVEKALDADLAAIAADAVIAEIIGGNVPSGTGEPNTSATHDEPTGP